MSEELPASTASGPFSPPAATIALLAPGTFVGARYRVDEVIGTGGYGVVYLAFDRELNRNVALKVLRPERASPEGLARFRREVAVAREISSPRLVRVFDIGSAENAIYLTMEHVEGESLKERLRRGPMSIDEAIATSVAILEGLEALHAAGVIHRDVKPGNVLLGANGEVKLGDFGLARSGLDESSLTHSGTLLGTSEYVAPEQALGKELDLRSDLYSAGIVMYEMLTGLPPFSAESALGVLLARLKGPPPDPRKIRPEIPAWLARVVLRLLERKPGDRYPDAAAVLHDLGRRHARFRIRRRAQVLGVTVLVLLGFVGFVTKTRLDTGRFSRLAALSGGGIQAIARGGRILWTMPEVDPSVASRYTLARIRKNGPPLIATVLRNADDWDPVRGRVMSFIDPQSGSVVKQASLPEVDRSFSEESKHFYVDRIDAIDLNEDGIDEVVGTYISRMGIGSYTFLYEPSIDRARDIFHGSGHHRFVTAADLDADGLPEIVLSGINNRLGWYNAAAAIRLVPPVNELRLFGGSVSPDLSTSPYEEESLVWYALLPRGQLQWNETGSFDGSSRTLTFSLRGGATYRLSSDGFLRHEAHSNTTKEAAARSRSYSHLRQALRSERAGEGEFALNSIERALAEAREASDALLMEAVERQKARLLVTFGHLAEGERAFEALMSRSENRPEIAFQAGEAHHLAGRLDDAIGWYWRGFAAGGEVGVGLPKPRFLQGMILVLAEQHRWEEALEVADSYYAAYGSASEFPRVYREFILWRMGQRPRYDAVLIESSPEEPPRYWMAEFMNLDGVEPEKLLPMLEPVEWSAEIRPVAQSLRAEVLFRAGREAEAVEEARRAALLCEGEARRSTFARAHLELVRERLARIEETAGRSN